MARTNVPPRSSRAPLEVRRTVFRSSLRVRAATLSRASPAVVRRCATRASSIAWSTIEMSMTLLTFFP
jgi:hypothetical protein